jgi:hypothetical protein
MWIVAIDEEEPIMGTSFIDYLHHLQDPIEVRTATLILARRTCHAMTNYQELRSNETGHFSSCIFSETSTHVFQHWRLSQKCGEFTMERSNIRTIQ